MQKLERRFNPFHLLLLSINGMVGSAWLFAPFYAAKIAGSGALIAWLLGGAMTVLIAISFAELSVMIPVPGGSTAIPKISHGQFASFMMGWLAWLSSLTMAPIEIQAVLQYASTYFPSLVLSSSEHGLSAFGFLWAVILMLFMCVLNIYSFRGLLRSNFFILGYKLLVMTLLVIMVPSLQFNTFHFSELVPTMSSLQGWHSIFKAVAAGGIAFAFTGFKHGVELAGEATHKQITLPLAIIGSIVCCLILYMALQVVFIGALPSFLGSEGWGGLHFSGDAGPFAGILLALGLMWLLKLLYVDAVVSPLGAGLIYMTSTARITYSMASNHYLPGFLMKVNSERMPIAAIFLNGLIGLSLFLPFSGWQSMSGFLVSVMVIAYGMGPLSLLAMRKQMPERQRDFHLPFAPVLCPLAFYCCVLLSYWTGWETISKLAIVSVIGMVVFLLAFFRGRLNKDYLGLRALGWFIPFIGGLTLISYFGDFGGKHLIPFGWDFLVLAVFSGAILILAVKTALPGSRASQITERILEELP